MAKAKEYVINTEDGYSTRYGTDINDNSPKVLYIRTKTRVTPTTKKDKYFDDVEGIRKSLSKYAREKTKASEQLDDSFIFNIDMSGASASYSKKSFLRYEFFAKPLEPKPMTEHEELFISIAKDINGELDKILSKYDFKRC